MTLVSSAAGHEAEPQGSETAPRAAEGASPDAVQRYIEYAKTDGERQRQACDMAIADYQARCPIGGNDPYLQTRECAELQDYIRSRCYAEGKRKGE
jgi:hypothetical protein